MSMGPDGPGAGRMAGLGGAAVAALGHVARRGRIVLLLGLAAGIAFPRLAEAARPFIAEMAAVLLYLAALRIGPGAAAWGLRGIGGPLAAVLLYQMALPVAVAGAALAAGLGGPMAGALVLMAAAPSIAGGPSLTALAGADPAPAMRLLVLGTALLPLTALPAFWLSPGLGAPAAVAVAAGRLLLVIAGATGLALLTRRLALPAPGPAALRALDGLQVIGLAVLVVGLMAAVGPALRDAPAAAARAGALAVGANFGLQLLAFAALSAPRLRGLRVGYAVVAGNRNMALFLAALPPAVTDPMLLFIGLYQVPMFLTPALLGPLYRRAAG